MVACLNSGRRVGSWEDSQMRKVELCIFALVFVCIYIGEGEWSKHAWRKLVILLSVPNPIPLSKPGKSTSYLDLQAGV